MSSEARREFFFDRSLGKITADRLREAGYTVHLIADHYGNDATTIPDEQWIADGCDRGWVLLTKDKRIRYRQTELAALDGHLFCLSNGNAPISMMTDTLVAALPRIDGAASRHDAGFWHIYDDGTIKKMWP